MCDTEPSGIVSLEELEALGGTLQQTPQNAASARNEAETVAADDVPAKELTRQQRRRYERLIRRYKRWLDKRQVAYREKQKADAAGITFTLLELLVCPI